MQFLFPGSWVFPVSIGTADINSAFFGELAQDPVNRIGSRILAIDEKGNIHSAIKVRRVHASHSRITRVVPNDANLSLVIAKSPGLTIQQVPIRTSEISKRRYARNDGRSRSVRWCLSKVPFATVPEKPPTLNLGRGFKRLSDLSLRQVCSKIYSGAAVESPSVSLGAPPASPFCDALPAADFRFSFSSFFFCLARSR